MENLIAHQEGITITKTALERVRSLIMDRNLEGHALRVFVSGGGCSGMQYGMAIEGEPRSSDHRYTYDGVEVLVDPVSLGYLSGATIDYNDEIMGGGFQINNPNAVASCGCGHSFRTETSDQPAASGGECGCA